MTNAPLSRSTARTLTLGVQLLAVPLLAAAALAFGGGFGMVPFLDPPAPEPIEIELPQVSLPGASAAESTPEPPAELDVQGIAARLALLGNAPKAEPPETPDDPKQSAAPDPVNPDEQTIRDRVRYLGLMRAGPRTMALLDVDGRQRVVAGGRTIPGLQDGEQPVTLLSIATDKVVLRGKSARVEITRAPIDRPLVTAIQPTDQAKGTPRNPPSGVRSPRANRPSNTTRPDPLERRRVALQKAVDRGSISQEEVDRLLDQAAQRQADRDARNEARRLGEDN